VLKIKQTLKAAIERRMQTKNMETSPGTILFIVVAT
jgi:hypothetical protein